MRTPTLLCVDDDQGILEFYQTLFGACGYQVLVAECGRTALEVFRVHGSEIDAVIVDQKMPGMSGIELAAQLKQLSARLPVMMISGHHPSFEGTRLIEASVPKGATVESILSQIERLLLKLPEELCVAPSHE